MDKNFVLATATLIGTIIGAGVFGLPYIMAKSGIALCFFYFLLLGFVVLFLHLFLGEITLRTKGKHRLVGFATKYLGTKARFFTAVSTIIGSIGSLLAYIILGGKFLKIVFPFVFSEAQLALILWAVLSLFVLLGIRSITRAEFLMNIGFFAVIVLIFFFSFQKIALSNFVLINSQHLFLPFGVILFSLVGWNAVPEIQRVLKKKKDLKKVIFSAIIISAIFYFLFALAVSGVSGTQTSEEAFQGLFQFFGTKIMLIGGIFGLLSISTSFLVLANHLKNTLIFDFNISYVFAFLLACLPPLALFFFGIKEFIWIISFVGIFVGAIEGTIIVLAHKKAKIKGTRKPEYSVASPKFLFYFIPAVLILGAISQIIAFLF